MRSVDALRKILDEVNETEANNTRNASTDYRARDFIRTHGAVVLKAAEQLMTLRAAAGYVENGTDTTVKLFQDDATRNWHVKVGNREYWGESFEQAVDAVAADQEADA